MSSPVAWFIRKNGVVHGPASAQDLQHLLKARQISLDDEAAASQIGPWQPLAKFPEFAPVRPISDLFQSPAPTPQAPPPLSSHKSVSPTAERLLAGVLNNDAPAAPGALSEAARLEFSQSVFKDTEKVIENKCFPWTISLDDLALILLARFNMIFALIAGAVVAGITYKSVQFALSGKYLDPIEKMSDAMLTARYNELKADARAAKTRSAVGWVVFVIIALIVVIAWAAARAQH